MGDYSSTLKVLFLQTLPERLLGTEFREQGEPQGHNRILTPQSKAGVRAGNVAVVGGKGAEQSVVMCPVLNASRKGNSVLTGCGLHCQISLTVRTFLETCTEICLPVTSSDPHQRRPILTASLEAANTKLDF